MRLVLRGLGFLLLALLIALALVWTLAPREPVDFARVFDPAAIGSEPEAYLAAQEARFDDIVDGAEKHIVWAEDPGTRTETVLVYIHGFSATAHEIRPVPDRVAEALGANLVFTRLSGHGRGGPAMAEPRIADWVTDFDEAIAVAERLGDRVVVIATSTGATLATAAMAEGRADDVDAIVMVSPNFRIANPAAAVLTLPAARHWVPPLFGRERGFEPQNEDHAAMWTTHYPTEALFPMAALVAYARTGDLRSIGTPALILFSPEDGVVDASATRDVAALWGGPVTLSEQTLGPGDDPSNHVIAGDALSPGRTGPVADEIIGWIEGL